MSEKGQGRKEEEDMDNDEMRSQRIESTTVELRKNKDEDAQQKKINFMVDAVNNIIAQEEKNKAPLSEEKVQNLVQQASCSDNPEQQWKAVSAVRNLLCSENPPIEPLLKAGILPILVDCLGDQATNSNLQLEAARALTNIAAGTSEQTQAVVDSGAVRPLISLLTSAQQEVQEQAVWALGNIIGNDAATRDHVISAGALQPLLNLIQQPDIPIEFLHILSWALINLCRNNNSRQSLQEILPALKFLVNHDEIQAVVDSVVCLGFIVDGANAQIQMVIDSGILPKLVSLLGHSEVRLQTVAIQALANIVTGTDEQTQAVLNCDGILSHFQALLTHTKPAICKAALCFMSNIAAGSVGQVQTIIDAQLFPYIIAQLTKGEFQVQVEAAWTVSNAAIQGDKDQVEHLISCNFIEPFCNLLSCKDAQVIQMVLDGISSTFKTMDGDEEKQEQICFWIEECGGLDKIEALQDHENVIIYDAAYSILENYFLKDENTDQNPNNLA